MRELPPFIYHLAEDANLESILKQGLYSTSMMLEIAGYTEWEREKIVSCQRTQHTILKNSMHIRDQKPMPPNALKACLVNFSVAQWYVLLNSKIFFWISRDRLERQKAACHPRKQHILTFDTKKLLADFRDYAYVSPINTGFALRKPALRGRETFVRYTDWLNSAWTTEANYLGTKKRNASHLPVELTIDVAIKDIKEYLCKIE